MRRRSAADARADRRACGGLAGQRDRPPGRAHRDERRRIRPIRRIRDREHARRADDRPGPGRGESAVTTPPAVVAQPDVEAWVWAQISAIPGVTSFCYAAVSDWPHWLVRYSLQIDVPPGIALICAQTHAS